MCQNVFFSKEWFNVRYPEWKLKAVYFIVVSKHLKLIPCQEIVDVTGM